MKKNYLTIGIAIIIFVAVAICSILIALNQSVTITFESNGGNTVDKIVVKKGERVNFPKPVKEGFVFDGWYLNADKITENSVFDEDVTLKANWVTPTFRVSFDSAGGSKVEDIIVNCGDELRMPSNPVRTGYSFVTWVDKNEMPIYDQALLTCDDILLTAKWNKD